MMRYLLADTGGFFGGKRVLLAPNAFRHADWSTRTFHVQLTMEQVEHAPGSIRDATAHPPLLASPSRGKTEVGRDVPPGGDRLRSVNELRGYHVEGSDDQIGHIEDLIVDDMSWDVRHLIFDANNSWFGERVLVAPHWASRVSWDERKIFFHMTREAIRNSPVRKADAGINSEYEVRLYNYCGRPVSPDLSS